MSFLGMPICASLIKDSCCRHFFMIDVFALQIRSFIQTAISGSLKEDFFDRLPIDDNNANMPIIFSLDSPL